ncbi:hypothetical protein [Bradyrhizobium sp. CB3481]|uniref:hypothetical protein n=1 Tax=Bradyrhizobium sp. CB3481 TaxID=3039158 RepID=UPI0024B09B84|nr:hypothetical protein [Bradyrhizobium sp. CB3481]WFU16828.1 hypothetical protein QA643_00245 [Bradyrhizobium sp. CB3481]
MPDRDVRITLKTSAGTRALKSFALLAPIGALWLLLLAEVLSAIFAEKVFYAGRLTPLHWVTYREEGGLFVFVFVTSLAGVCYLGWILLGLISHEVGTRSGD